MASGLTHILLTRKLQDYLPDGDLKNIFAYAGDSLQVGAVAPDIPYSSIVDNNIFHSHSFLADDFHYKNTNQIPLRSLMLLKDMKGKIDESTHYHMFSFYLGYISHVFGDGIIHPFVRDKVGEYQENAAAHRNLEMQLDVLLLRHFTEGSGLKLELNYTNIHKELLNFSTIESTSALIKTFSSLIEDIYQVEFKEKDILGWVKGLYRLFDLAEGSFPVFARNSKWNTVLYRNYDDINREEILNLKVPKDRNENFLKTECINFINQCLPQYFSKYIEVAQKAYEFVYEDGVSLSDKDIPPINLDTGRLIENNDLDQVPILWINN